MRVHFEFDTEDSLDAWGEKLVEIRAIERMILEKKTQRMNEDFEMRLQKLSAYEIF